MDPGSLYPSGFHPAWQDYTPDIQRYAKHGRRSNLTGDKRVRYYFVDFGISTLFPESPPDGTSPGIKRLVTGADGLEQDVPELRVPSYPYDPFAVDICILGYLFRKAFIWVRQSKPAIAKACRFRISDCSFDAAGWANRKQKYSNLGFLTPLTRRMTVFDPEARPTAPQALQLFEEIAQSLTGSASRRLLRKYGEERLASVAKNITQVSLEAKYHFKHLFRECVVYALFQLANFVVVNVAGTSLFC